MGQALSLSENRRAAGIRDSAGRWRLAWGPQQVGSSGDQGAVIEDAGRALAELLNHVVEHLLGEGAEDVGRQLAMELADLLAEGFPAAVFGDQAKAPLARMPQHAQRLRPGEA